MIEKWYAALAIIPVTVLLAAPALLPAGSDPRGYGPKLIGALVAFALSGLFATFGLILIAVRSKSPQQVVLCLLGTVLSAAPLLALVMSPNW